MGKANYYDVLSVDVNADNEQIKRAYREAAKKYHPDVNKSSDSEELFKIVKEAYDTLINDERRREYDKTLPLNIRKNRRRNMANEKKAEEVFEEKKPEKDYPLLDKIRIIFAVLFFVIVPVGYYFFIEQNLNALIIYCGWIILLYIFTKMIWGLSVVGIAAWCGHRLLEGDGEQAFWGILAFLAVAIIVWVIKPSVLESNGID